MFNFQINYYRTLENCFLRLCSLTREAINLKIQRTVEKNRSSRSQMFFKIGVLKNLANFTGKHQC